VRLIVDRGRNAGGESGDVGEGDGDSDSDSDSDSDDEDEGRGGNDDDDEDEWEESEDDDEDDEDVGEDEGRDAKAGRLFDGASEGGGGSGSSSSSSPSPSPSSSAAAAQSASSSSSSSSSSKSTNSQVTTLAHAITIAHEYSLDLVGVTLASNPPVIKAVDIERYLYDMKRRAAKAIKAKRRGGGGAISDRPLKEYKFRAGIAEHDLARKANGMMEYLGRGHAVRVTLTARQRSLKDDADAIRTTLERVRELLGDKAVEARGMKSNDRNSYGTLLLHPSKK
jgi:translation initiation factor IF-3